MGLLIGEVTDSGRRSEVARGRVAPNKCALRLAGLHASTWNWSESILAGMFTLNISGTRYPVVPEA